MCEKIYTIEELKNMLKDIFKSIAFFTAKFLNISFKYIQLKN